MKQWLTIALICALTAGIVLLLDTRPDLLNPLAEPKKAEFERFPYAVLHDAKTSHFNEDGSLSYAFDAVTLKHFRADMDRSSAEDYMLMTAPKLTLYTDAQAAPWFLTAKHGKAMAKGDLLELWNDVTLWRVQNGERTELTTDNISIYPQTKQLKTQATVKIQSPNGKVSADGLEVDMIKQRYKLLANVRGQHDPIE